MRNASSKQSGHAMTETLLVASFAGFVLTAIPAIADYGIKRMQTVAAARLVAWQRNVWLPEAPAIDAAEASGAAGAIKRTDAEVTRDLRRHIFRDRAAPGISIHADAIAEFEPSLPDVDPRTTSIRASTTAARLPFLMDANEAVWRPIRAVQKAISGNQLTPSLGKFSFVTGGYLRHRVDVTLTDPRFALLPQVAIGEEVTMLTEAWNAGGTLREEKKVQGLVPLKVADSVFYQQLRSALHQSAYQISQVYPGFANANLSFGLQPGDAYERAPLDRFERYPAMDGSSKDRFRYYRAFPPTPGVNTLP